MTDLNPDCRVGKHPSCAGDAWDDATDSPSVCPCPCHGSVGESIDSVMARVFSKAAPVEPAPYLTQVARPLTADDLRAAAKRIPAPPIMVVHPETFRLAQEAGFIDVDGRVDWAAVLSAALG